MAKFKAILGALRGSISNNVFSHNTYGDYVRNRTTPVNPNTPAQAAVRLKFSENSGDFSNLLTPIQQQEWSDFAVSFPRTDSLGNTYILSGIAMFNSINQILRQYNLSVLTTPPLNLSVEKLLTVTTTFTVAAGLDFAFTPTPMGADTRMVFFMTSPLSGGIKFVKNRYRFVGVSSAAEASPIDLTGSYTTKFGAPVAGNRIGWKVFFLNDSNGAVDVALTGITAVT